VLQKVENRAEQGDTPPARRRALRPRDAATLILVRRDCPEPAVLMGHRSARHVFLPNTFVFPGGRVDPEDARVPVAAPLREAAQARLTRHATPTRARALALTAIRGAFEETRPMLGRPATGLDPERVPASWRGFFERGLAPAPAGVITVAAPDTCCALSEADRERRVRRGVVEVKSSRTGQTRRWGRAWLAEQREDPEGQDVRGAVGRIECPMLIAHGTADPTVDPG